MSNLEGEQVKSCMGKEALLSRKGEEAEDEGDDAAEGD